MQLNKTDYLDQVMGCWLGKNAGGTLGMPTEWFRQVNHVTFYTQDLKGEPVPNDDLDLQLVWLHALETHGIDLNSRTLADYWLLYVTPHYSEYGTGKSNLRFGLPPPLSGSVDNAYKNSCGAFIRSEIWACIAPGLPAVAARYAYEDAIVDHGNGEGTYAEVFTAALQSAAFVVGDLRQLVWIALSYLPPECGVARAVRTVVALVDAGKDWLEIRDEILRSHRGSAFFNLTSKISPDDIAKGFFDGVQGYDAPSNIAITVLALLHGGDDFGRVLCTAVNCGEDTDCTAATAGATWGIIHGAKAIPERWIAPIGREIRTLCVNNAELYPPPPKTIEELTERTARVAAQLLARHPGMRLVDTVDTVDTVDKVDTFASPDHGAALYDSPNGPKFEFELFTVRLDYGDGPFVRNGEAKTLAVTLRSKVHIPAAMSLHWYLPEGWTVAPTADAGVIVQQAWYNEAVTLRFAFACDQIRQVTNRLVLELTAANRACMLHVPVTFLDGNVRPVVAAG
jgi:ADP-ribosylglycohydrolase